MIESAAVDGASLFTCVESVSLIHRSVFTTVYFTYYATTNTQVGGPIGLLKDGDKITIDADKKAITVDISDVEMDKRKKEFVPRPYKATRGTLYKYIKNVSSASKGCVTDE